MGEGFQSLLGFFALTGVTTLAFLLAGFVSTSVVPFLGLPRGLFSTLSPSDPLVTLPFLAEDFSLMALGYPVEMLKMLKSMAAKMLRRRRM